MITHSRDGAELMVIGPSRQCRSGVVVLELSVWGHSSCKQFSSQFKATTLFYLCTNWIL